MKLVFTNIRAFVDIASMAITIGGDHWVNVISFPGAFAEDWRHLKIIVRPMPFNPGCSRQPDCKPGRDPDEGLLSLEDKL